MCNGNTRPNNKTSREIHLYQRHQMGSAPALKTIFQETYCKVSEMMHYLITNKRDGAEYFSIRKHSLTYTRNYPLFIEPEGSLPCSQQPDAGPYHEPDELSPQLPALLK
jgi:hypothetical protein